MIHSELVLCSLSVLYFIVLPILSSTGQCGDNNNSISSISTASATTRCGSLFGFFAAIPLVILFDGTVTAYLAAHHAKWMPALHVGKALLVLGMALVLASPVTGDAIPPMHSAGILVLALGNVLSSATLLTTACSRYLKVLVGVQLIVAFVTLLTYALAGGGVVFLVLEIVVFALFSAVVSAITEQAHRDKETTRAGFPRVCDDPNNPAL